MAKSNQNPPAETPGELLEQERQQIIELGMTTLSQDGNRIHCLSIIGQIEGHQVLPATVKSTKYEHVLPQLAAIEADEEVDGLLILLNTVGGDIEAGLAIAELIAGMKTPTVSLVLGGGHSIGVPLAVSARKSLIVPSAAMTIHPVRTSGLVIGVQQSFAYLEKIQDRIVEFVVKNSRIRQQTFMDLMLNTGELAQDVGSVVYGKQAVEIGLIDQLGSLSDALTCLRRMIDTNRRRQKKAQTENC